MHIWFLLIILCLVAVVAVIIGFILGKKNASRSNGNFSGSHLDFFRIFSSLPLEGTGIQICMYDMKTDIITLKPNPRNLVTEGMTLFTFLEQVDEQDKSTFIDSINFLKEKGAVSFQYKIKYKDKAGVNKEMWLSNFTFICERDKEGTPLKSISILRDITANLLEKQADMIRRLHTDRLLRSLHMILWSYDGKTNEIKNESLSPGMFEILRLEDYINTCVLPEFQSMVSEAFSRCLQRLTTDYDVVYKAYIEDKKVEWVHSIGQVVSAADPLEPIQILGHCGIITEEKQAALKLQETNTMLKLSLKASKMIPWKYDLTTNTYFTESSIRPGTIVTLEISELLNQHFFPEDVKFLNDWLDRLRHAAVSTIDINMKCFIESKADVKWVQITGEVADRDVDGRPVSVVGTHRFISNDMNYRMLLRQKEQLEFTLKVSKMTAWIYTRSNGILSIFSGDSEAPRNMTLFDYVRQLVEAPYRQEILKNVNDLISGKRSSLIFTYRRLNDNGEYRILECAAMGTDRDISGMAGRIIGSSKDKTEEEQKLEELVELHKKAEEANRLKTAFLANMSHEIRTPLNAIVGFSHIVAQGLQPENNEEFCQIIESNNKLLLQLISDIIDLSQIEADQMEFESKEFDICKMIRDAHAHYSANLSENVEMICDLPDKSLIVKSDQKRLSQVLTNILDNAVKHTNKGYITIGYFSESKDIRFFVRDTGEGIAEPNLPHVFDRFAKFDAFAQGTGLGLSLCQSIVKKFGGEIGVKSKLGKGSEFWFTLPANDSICEAS